MLLFYTSSLSELDAHVPVVEGDALDGTLEAGLGVGEVLVEQRRYITGGEDQADGSLQDDVGGDELSTLDLGQDGDRAGEAIDGETQAHIVGGDLGVGVLDRAIWGKVEHDQVVECILRDFQGRNRRIESWGEWWQTRNTCDIRGVWYLVYSSCHGGIKLLCCHVVSVGTHAEGPDGSQGQDQYDKDRETAQGQA